MEQRPARLSCDFGIGDTIGHVIIWIILVVVTFGLALFVFPRYLPKAILNRTKVIGENGQEIGRLSCDLTLPSMIGNAVIWLILTAPTVGLAYIFYIYRVHRIVISETRVVYP